MPGTVETMSFANGGVLKAFEDEMGRRIRDFEENVGEFRSQGLLKERLIGHSEIFF